MFRRGENLSMRLDGQTKAHNAVWRGCGFVLCFVGSRSLDDGCSLTIPYLVHFLLRRVERTVIIRYSYILHDHKSCIIIAYA